ncbi:MAG: hypothetical protein J5I90_11455 [Caldilineales bacterium]|nr:hypothetical protein [Caldilineales bacterium]
MHITHSYKGSVQGSFRYSFFVLYEDYIQAQSSFSSDFDLMLERFARNMRDEGVVVRPFLGDVEKAKSDVLTKNWSPKHLKELEKTPGLLVINKDFDEFDPQEHQWLYLNFGGRVYDSPVRVDEYQDILASLAEIVSDPESDFFRDAVPVVRQLKIESFAEIFEAKPGIFGFSVDLKKSAIILREMFECICSPYQLVRGCVA